MKQRMRRGGVDSNWVGGTKESLQRHAVGRGQRDGTGSPTLSLVSITDAAVRYV